MAFKTIQHGEAYITVRDSGALVGIRIKTSLEYAEIFLTEDQARELGQTLEAFAIVVSPQESDRCK